MMAAPASPGMRDAGEAGRVVASVLAASTPLPGELVAHANLALTRLGLAPLAERDFTPSTPEEVAPIIPPQLHDALADLIMQLAGQDPMRRRVAQSYLALWRPGARIASRAPQRSPMVERVARV